MDSNDVSVAYFEVPGSPDVSFAVSQLMLVSTVNIGLDTNGARYTAIKIACLDPSLAAIFTTFIEDLIGDLSEEADVPQLIVASAARWRRLLQVAGRELSAHAMAGIYGELLFLERAVAELGSSSLHDWQRQKHDSHDFSGATGCVEVKTTGMQSRAAVGIHGLRQMLPCSPAPLTLAVAEVAVTGAGESIDDVIERVLTTGVDPELFADKLADQGYVYKMPASEKFSFELRTWRFWSINENSPVLSSRQLSEEVMMALANVSYDLVLSALGEASSSFDFAALDATKGGSA
ncbi:PD-(D/E)XK motif protein [Pseudoclavibacter helvolus]|uniref:PD-(D/E)XK motif protein n=1 Tax=Pseudoclavibacter helvolus TaxID=255205 RepID=UPI003C736C6F